MKSSFQTLSPSEQLAAHLREELGRGRWTETMPGQSKLVAELGVGTETVRNALAQLENEGWLVSQGKRQRRRIQVPEDTERRGLRVAIFLYEPSAGSKQYLLELRHQLTAAGHNVVIASQTLMGLKMDVQRVSLAVNKMKADAWVVEAGSREVLEWFADQSTPAFALFGRLIEVPLASTSPKKAPAYKEIIARLVELRHRRIVNLVREERRKPTLGFMECLFLEQLQSHGIQTGIYNLPDWENSPEGLQRVLDSLFQHSPPTALLIDEVAMFHAVRDHLARKGIIAPQHVSLICCDFDPSIDWCIPTISHIRWDFRPIVRRVVQWVNNLAVGKEDRIKSSTLAEFVEGGTIGPAPKG